MIWATLALSCPPCHFMLHVYSTANLSNVVPGHFSGKFNGHAHKILSGQTIFLGKGELSWCTGSHVRQAIFMEGCGEDQMVRQAVFIAINTCIYLCVVMVAILYSLINLKYIQISLPKISEWLRGTKPTQCKPINTFNCSTMPCEHCWELLLWMKSPWLNFFLNQSRAIHKAYDKQILTINCFNI